MTKVCNKCKIEKEDSCFMKRSDGHGVNLRAWCTDCFVLYNKQNRDKNPSINEKAKIRTKNWCTKFPEKAKNSWLKKKFGITLEERNEILAKQGNKCANTKCNVTHPGYYKSKNRQGKERDWHLDHDHKTNKIRAVLCPNCNLTLGHALEDIQRLEGLIEYLKLHNGVNLNE